MEKNIQSYKNIKAFNFGLGSSNGNFKVYLSDDSENFGGASFYPNAQGNKSDPYVAVEIKADFNSSLDQLMTKFPFQRVRFSKYCRGFALLF